MFTDDDIVPSRTWLRTLHAATARWPDDSIFGGPILPKFPPNTPAWVRDPAFVHASIAYGRYEPGAAEGPVELAPFGANLGIRRDVFERYSFDRTIGPAGQQYAQGSEYELTRRLNLDGYRNVHVPSAPVEHVIRSDQVSVEWLLERAHRFGRGTERIHPSQQIPGVGTLPAALRIRWAIARCLRALSAPFPPRLRFALARHDAYLRGRADECARRAGGELRSPGSGYA